MLVVKNNIPIEIPKKTYETLIESGKFNEALSKINTNEDYGWVEIVDTEVTIFIPWQKKGFVFNQYDLEKENEILALKSTKTFEVNECFNGPYVIVKFMVSNFEIDKKAEETLYAIGLNAKNQPCGVFHVADGSSDACMASSRSVMQRMLLCGAVNFVLVHNHPSGDAVPGATDMALTKKMERAGKILEINLVDHVIIGKGTYYSFNENDVLE